MTDEKWDGDRFRRQMKSQSSADRRYADEHRGRLRRGQSNGDEGTVHEYEGRSVVSDVLSTDARTDRPKDLLDRLDELEQHDSASGYIGDKDAYRRGYEGRIREIRSKARKFVIE